MQQAPHIGNMLKTYVKQHRIFQSGWARQQGLTPNTVARYLKQPAMRVDTLFAICQTLNHNFFKDIAAMLPASMPPETPAAPATETLAALQQQVSNLQLQVATLEKALALVGGR